jgi:hypothetical protein
VGRNRCTTTDIDKDTESDQVENSSKDDEKFKATSFKNDKAEDAASNNTTEAKQN